MKFRPPQLGRRAQMVERIHCRLMGLKPETSCDGKRRAERSVVWVGSYSLSPRLWYLYLLPSSMLIRTCLFLINTKRMARD